MQSAHTSCPHLPQIRVASGSSCPYSYAQFLHWQAVRSMFFVVNALPFLSLWRSAPRQAFLLFVLYLRS